MANLTILRIDYNGDIKGILDILVKMTHAKDDVTRAQDALSPSYSFNPELWDSTLTLHENPAVYDEGSPYSACRFYIEIDGVDQLRCIRDLCILLRSQDNVAFEVREVFSMPDTSYQPATFKPEYDVITRHMPAVIMMKTRLKNKQLADELRALTGLAFTGMGECVKTIECPSERVMYSYMALIDWHRRPEFRELYGGFQASHRIQVFGFDDDPANRRVRRDTFAQSLYDNISKSERLEARIYEVVAGRVRPLGTTSGD